MEKWDKNHHSGEISRGGTGTKQSGTGIPIVFCPLVPVPNALFWTVFVFWHNLVISNPI